MESFIKLVLRPWQILVLLLALILLSAVGCGSATAPAATAPAATAPAATAPAASAAPAPDKGTAPMPDKSEPSAPAAAAPIAPTSAPMTMPEPAEAMVEIHPGKLTIMVGDLANERFDQVFQFGLPGELNYGRLVHGFLASASEDKEIDARYSRELESLSRWPYLDVYHTPRAQVPRRLRHNDRGHSLDATA